MNVLLQYLMELTKSIPRGNLLLKKNRILLTSLSIFAALGVIIVFFALHQQEQRNNDTHVPVRQQPALAKTPQEAVARYIYNLNTAHAHEIIASSAEKPTDETFLTSQILTQNYRDHPLKQAKYTVRRSVADPTTAEVSVTLRQDNRTITFSMPVVTENKSWRIVSGFITVTLPKNLIQTPALELEKHRIFPHKQIQIFPGQLHWSLHGPLFNVTSSTATSIQETFSALQLNSLENSPDTAITQLHASLTKLGHQKVQQFIQENIQKCAEKKSDQQPDRLKPGNCPLPFSDKKYSQNELSEIETISLSEPAATNTAPLGSVFFTTSVTYHGHQVGENTQPIHTSSFSGFVQLNDKQPTISFI